MPETTAVSLEVLRTLHRLHRQLTDLRHRLDQGPRRIRAAEQAAAIRGDELARARDELKRMKVAADQKELQLKSNEGKLKDLDRKLMSASSNREYQALKDQIAADRMANSVLEEEILDAFSQIENQEKRVAELDRQLQAAQQRLAEVKAQAADEAPVLQADIARAEAELAQTESVLTGDVAELYQRGVRQKGEDALAAIENGVCSGCHQLVPVQIVSQVILGRPSFCKTCGRLLYLREEDERRRKTKDDNDE